MSTESSPSHNVIGQAADNKIQDSGASVMPASGSEEFTDRPPHMRNRPESWAYENEKSGLYEHGM